MDRSSSENECDRLELILRKADVCDIYSEFLEFNSHKVRPHDAYTILIRRIEKSETQNKKLLEWINSTIDSHKMICEARNNAVVKESAKKVCTCGLDELLKEVKND